MAEGNGADQGAEQVKMQVLGQFVRDLSFENAVAQRGVQGGDVQPDTQVAVSLDARKRTVEHQYEVITKFRITSKNKSTDETLFMVELDYGGIFHVEGVPEEQMHPFLLIECPRMLFPFVRRIISDVTRDGGFPPLNVDNVDFLALYRQELARRAQAAPTAAPTAAEATLAAEPTLELAALPPAPVEEAMPSLEEQPLEEPLPAPEPVAPPIPAWAMIVLGALALVSGGAALFLRWQSEQRWKINTASKK